ncbi:hypothetical protein H4582DRAFT_2073139 [Lactarius indigo]|nr:hypothetical protein H4582DRAFT_2073139 [Lactarius indigo]
MIHPDPPPDLPPNTLSDSNLYFDHFSTPPILPDTSNMATPGPTTTDGYGQPIVQGNPGTALHPITISFDIPTDSRMNSPESEESTHPAVLAGPHASALPPQPEEIMIRGRNTSRMPRAGLRRLSNASAWTHITQESLSQANSPTRFSSPPPHIKHGAEINKAVAGKHLPPPLTVLESNMRFGTSVIEALDLDHEQDIKQFEVNDETLQEEFAREINDVVMGYSRFYLKSLLQFLRDHSFSFTKDNLQTAALLTIQALDAGTAGKSGETAVPILTPAAWHCLSIAILAAIIRGILRSPCPIMTGTKSMNWSSDSFITHDTIEKPLTVGGTIHALALQLVGYYDTKRINPLHTNPTSYFDDLVAKQLAVLERAAQHSATTAQAIHEEITSDPTQMAQLRQQVKDNIFSSLNQEALDDLDNWKAIYHEEFSIVMQKFIADNNFLNIDPCFLKTDIKGKRQAKSATPEIAGEIEQIESLMRTDCQAQVDAMQRDLLTDMKATMECKVTALRTKEFNRIHTEAVTTLQRDAEAFKTAEADRLRTQAIAQIDHEIATLKSQYHQEQEQYIRNVRDKVRKDLKGWKVRHCNARTIGFLVSEAKKLGYILVANSPDAFKPTKDPVEAELDWLPSSNPPSHSTSRATSPEHEVPRTPPLAPLPIDNNITPTPVHTKCFRTDDLEEPNMDSTQGPSPRVPKVLFPHYAEPPSEDSPLPPAERIKLVDHMIQDHPLDVLQDTLNTNGGTAASMHVVTCKTEPTPTAQPPPSEPVEEPAPPTASTAEDSDLLTMMKAIMATIHRLEDTVSHQNERINALASNKTPPAARKPAKPKEAVTAPPKANTGSTSAAVMDEVLCPEARTDDPMDAAPAAASTPKPPPINQSTRPPALDVPASWAKVVTQNTVAQHITNKAFNQQANLSTGRNNQGKRNAAAANQPSAPNTTDITVIRGHGHNNPETEEAIYKTPPSDIIAAARSQLEKTAANPIQVLMGRWSLNTQGHHNFVYRFTGKLSFKDIIPYTKALVLPLHVGELVPTAGWVHAQVQDVPTSGDDGIVFSPDQLVAELRRNLVFSDAIICNRPHWQNHPNNLVHRPTAAFNFAYLDEDGSLSKTAQCDGTDMFNHPV